MQINKVGERRWFKLFGHFSLVTLLFASTLGAQSFENFKRKNTQAYLEYKDKEDARFETYLAKQWKEFTASKEETLYEKPKPIHIQSTTQKKIQKLGPLVLIKLAKTPDTNLTKPVQIKKTSKPAKDIYIDFFGQDVGVNVVETYADMKFYPQTQEGITNYFKSMATSEYEDTLSEFQRVKQELKLNDWGVYLLVKSISESLYRGVDEQKLFTWFYLNKLGYSVKIALANKHLLLMHYSKKDIYAASYFTFAKKRYYVLSKDLGSSKKRVYTYEYEDKKAAKPLDLSLAVLPNFQQDLHEKKIGFTQFGKKYTASYTYDKNLIDFMNTYPQADYETYFNAPMQEQTYDQLAASLKNYIDGKKSSEGINFVLNFVQKSFKYERDQSQFGKEKVMFADETLFFDKSDCEDRAILFAHLVKKLFKISVVGVKYSDHMATAIYVPLDGDSVRVNRKKYIVADPTYINANIGMSMPKYRHKLPESFILVKGK